MVIMPCVVLDFDSRVIDLEASVPQPAKEFARQNIVQFFAQQHTWPTAVRINPLHTLDGITDIQVVLNCSYKPDIILIPQLTSAEEITIIKTIFNNANYQPLIYGIIETPQGLYQINNIAANCNGIIFGSADYAAALGVPIGEWVNMLHIRQQIIAGCAIYGIPAFDTAFFHINDLEGLSVECKLTRQLGFKGKAAIHPSQIKMINQIFSPSPAEITLAKKIINAMQTAEGITTLESMMVGPPFLHYAEKIISRMNELENKDN